MDDETRVPRVLATGLNRNSACRAYVAFREYEKIPGTRKVRRVGPRIVRVVAEHTLPGGERGIVAVFWNPSDDFENQRAHQRAKAKERRNG